MAPVKLVIPGREEALVARSMANVRASGVLTPWCRRIGDRAVGAMVIESVVRGLESGMEEAVGRQA